MDFDCEASAMTIPVEGAGDVTQPVSRMPSPSSPDDSQRTDVLPSSVVEPDQARFLATPPSLPRLEGTAHVKSVLSDTTKAFIAALAGAVVALILLPLSQVTAFVVNEYLARPILAIEYVEVVPEDAPVALPVTRLRELLRSPAQRVLLAAGLQGGNGLSLLEGRDSAKLADVKRLRVELTEFSHDTRLRLTVLSEVQEVLSSQSSDERIRGAIQKYSPEMATLSFTVPEPAKLRAIVAARVRDDVAALQGGLTLAGHVREIIDRPAEASTGRIWLKVSVVNRGSSDGLIRNIGELRVSSDSVALLLRRSNGPPAPKPEPVLAFESIPVSVVNQAPVEVRTTDVGKVEKHSVTELWFEADEAIVSASRRERLWHDYRESSTTASLVLFDHANARISTSVTLSGAARSTGR